MQTLRFRIVHVFAVVGFVAIVASLATLNGRGQSPAGQPEPQKPKTASHVKPTVLAVDPPSAKGATAVVAPFGVERTAGCAAVIHCTREPVGNQRA